MRDLSILIPARNEEWLAKTIEDILSNIEANTEVITVIDGGLPVTPIAQHERVTVVILPESIGQRAATNMACRLSTAKFVIKCDAHCAFDKGFDRKLIEDMNDNWTVVPAMRNLHVFDWVCECGYRQYQGPTIPCPKCGKTMTRDIKWYAKPSPLSTSYRVNNQLEFQYWGEYKTKQIGDIVDTMSLQGSCFMCSREKYWERELCDESWGSWGGQGAEISLKTWLSGGEVKCNKKTWYAHLFRTQGGDFSFPYPNPGNEQRSAKNKLREVFLNDKWGKAKHKLQWLIDKFAPVPDWTTVASAPEIPINQSISGTKGIIFYTDNQLNLKIAHSVQKQLRKINLPIVSASLKPMEHFGKNVHVKLPKGRLAYFTQIVEALKTSTAEYIFFAEHDVLYHPSHFDFTPPTKDKFYFNLNVWKWRYPENFFVKVDVCEQVSGMCVNRDFALAWYQKKLKEEQLDKFDKHYEPPENMRANWSSEFANIDIRHDANKTGNRWSPDKFNNPKYSEGWTEAESVKGWEHLKSA